MRGPYGSSRWTGKTIAEVAEVAEDLGINETTLATKSCPAPQPRCRAPAAQASRSIASIDVPALRYDVVPDPLTTLIFSTLY